MLRGWGALVAAALAGPAAGQGLYSDDELQAAYESMGRNIVLVVTEDIPAALPREVRAGAADITVDFVTRGEHPLTFFSQPLERRVIVPMESVLFIDDLGVASAWFEARGCDAGFVQAYLAAVFTRGGMPPPLVAFDIDKETALADPFVEDVSTKILDSTVNYLLAHEVGHVMLGHEGGLTGGASQEQEIAADRFALDFFTAVGTPPLGMSIYFNAGRWLDPAGGAGTHPVSGDRLRAIAGRLAADPSVFASGYSDPETGAALVAQVAGDLEVIADFAQGDEREILALALDREYPLSRLAGVCPG